MFDHIPAVPKTLMGDNIPAEAHQPREVEPVIDQVTEIHGLLSLGATFAEEYYPRHTLKRMACGLLCLEGRSTTCSVFASLEHDRVKVVV